MKREVGEGSMAAVGFRLRSKPLSEVMGERGALRRGRTLE